MYLAQLQIVPFLKPLEREVLFLLLCKITMGVRRRKKKERKMAVIVLCRDFFSPCQKIRAIEQVSQGCRWLAAGHIKSDQVQRRAESFKRRFLTPSLSHQSPLSLSQEGACILYFRGPQKRKKKEKKWNQSFTLLSPLCTDSQNISARN